MWPTILNVCSVFKENQQEGEKTKRYASMLQPPTATPYAAHQVLKPADRQHDQKGR
jgi:hypothetical protein